MLDFHQDKYGKNLYSLQQEPNPVYGKEVPNQNLRCVFVHHHWKYGISHKEMVEVEQSTFHPGSWRILHCLQTSKSR